MWTKSAFAALALQTLIAKASAGVAAKRAVTAGDDEPVTITRTVTHSTSGADGTATAVVDTETLVGSTITSVMDGTTIWVDTTVTIGCSLCASKSKYLSTVTSATASTTTGASSGDSETDTDDDECSTETDDYDYTSTSPVPAGTTTSPASGEETTPSSGEATTSIPYGGSESTPASAQETSVGGSATGEGSSVAYTPSSVILSTGNSGNTATPSGGIFTNSTGGYSTPSGNGPETTAVTTGENSAETGGELVVTETYTSEGVVTTDVSTVSTISSPVIIVIRQVTIFTFHFALGGNCPNVQHHSSGNGSYVVGEEGSSSSETYSGLGEACSSACYKQFKKCALAAGKNFDLSDCKTQLTSCLSSAATHTTSDSSAETVTQSVVLPSDATSSASSYIGGGVTVISTRTLTVSEVCTIGTSGVGITTTSGASTTAAATTTPAAAETTESVPMVETTTGITVSYVNEQGSTVTSYSTMTLTVPCTKCLASSTEVATTDVATTTSGDNSAETPSSHVSIVTLTNTVPNGSGGSTIVYSESTFAVPTGTETATGGYSFPGSATTPSGPDSTPSAPIGSVTLTNTVTNSNGHSSVVLSVSTFSIPSGSGTGPFGTPVVSTPGSGLSETGSAPYGTPTPAGTTTSGENSAETPSNSVPYGTPPAGTTTSGDNSAETPSSHISVVTLTNTVSNGHGGSTVVYSESTFAVPTGTETGPYGTGYNTKTVPAGEETTTSGENSAETPSNSVPYGTPPAGTTTSGDNSAVTGGSESSHISVITLTNTVPNGNGGSTVVYSESTFAVSTGTGTVPYGTGVYTQTAGTQTGVVGTETSIVGTETGVAVTTSGENSGETAVTSGAETTSVYGSVTGNEGQYSTSLITMSVPASGTHSATFSVITLTLSGSYTATGTGEVTQATETEVAVTSGGNSGLTTSGSNSGETGDVTYVTMTMSPTCSTCTGQETVVAVTSESETTQTNLVETNVVTVTMGGSTGVVTVTNTAVGVTETVTKGTETVTVTGGSDKTVTVTGGSEKTVTVTGGSEKTVTVTGSSSDKTVTVSGGSEKTITVTGSKTATIYVTQTGGSDKTVTITGTASVSTVTVTQNCSNGECSEAAQTATITASDCAACGLSTVTVTSCGLSEAAATTLATATSKARETVYVTQTVDQSSASTAAAKWRRVLGF